MKGGVDALRARTRPYQNRGDISAVGHRLFHRRLGRQFDLWGAETNPRHRSCGGFEDGACRALIRETESEFYIDEEMIREAIETKSSCNLLDLQSMVKVDIFLRQFNAWTDQEWKRRREERVGSEEKAIVIQVASPEDMILQKLIWYRMGGEVSDRQWRDVTRMLEVQRDRLDYDYLHHWAEHLGVTELLHRALQDAATN